jgi:hypothetical protein
MLMGLYSGRIGCMINKVRLAIGWILIIIPTYAAGAITTMYGLNVVDKGLFMQMVMVAIFGAVMGIIILTRKIPTGKRTKKNATKFTRN